MERCSDKPDAVARQASMPFIAGWIDTPAGRIPSVSTTLSRSDRLQAIRVRLAIGRMHHRVDPGLYAFGSPGSDSPVFVSANFKLSFDHLRRSLHGRDGWILVLDTRGINVWCAAGKGTFGTGEIVRKIQGCRLAEVVSHRTLIVPQLGGPGVAAHKVKEQTGFRIVYGPVRAADIPRFLDAGRKATPKMRKVTFTFPERMAVVPVELALGLKTLILPCAGMLALSGLGRHGYSLKGLAGAGMASVLFLLLAFAAGAALTPALLPWLPGRAFSMKGAVAGLLASVAIVAVRLSRPDAFGIHTIDVAAWFFLLPAVASFSAMNFTGASTYTSLSGVKKEMHFAVPAQIAAAAVGVVLWVAARFAR